MRIAAVLAVCLVLGATPAHAEDVPGKFIVFFSGTGTELSEQGQTIVWIAAAQIRSTHPASVEIAVGTGPDNRNLAERRFTAVRDALVTSGVDRTLIVRSEISGPKLLAAGAADQRVEIRLQRKAP
jgi:outer membrane protein OmpA-like peptidoglycan-associated protein